MEGEEDDAGVRMEEADSGADNFAAPSEDGTIAGQGPELILTDLADEFASRCIKYRNDKGEQTREILCNMCSHRMASVKGRSNRLRNAKMHFIRHKNVDRAMAMKMLALVDAEQRQSENRKEAQDKEILRVFASRGWSFD